VFGRLCLLQYIEFFKITGLSIDFLQVDVAAWESDANFLSAKKAVKTMCVVNDIAERGVALINEYNKLHTNDEEQKHYLRPVVRKFRKEHPDWNKSALMV